MTTTEGDMAEIHFFVVLEKSVHLKSTRNQIVILMGFLTTGGVGFKN